MWTHRDFCREKLFTLKSISGGYCSVWYVFSLSCTLRKGGVECVVCFSEGNCLVELWSDDSPVSLNEQLYNAGLVDTYLPKNFDPGEYKFGFRAFSNSAPRLLNAVPQVLREPESSPAFHGKLKTHLFSNQWLHHQPSLPLFLCVFCCSSYGKETSWVCAKSMAFLWMFSALYKYTINHHARLIDLVARF